jgi:DNA-binding XRE family transcriptional regulator
MKLNELLADARKGKEWSLRTLAAQIDVPHSTINQVETGWNKEPSFRLVMKIAKGLRIPMRELYEAE